VVTVAITGNGSATSATRSTRLSMRPTGAARDGGMPSCLAKRVTTDQESRSAARQRVQGGRGQVVEGQDAACAVQSSLGDLLFGEPDRGDLRGGEGHPGRCR
jgi:hypothetical protein